MIETRWGHYVSSDSPWKTPIACIAACANKLPWNINTVIDLGCANGRNFLPFEDRYNLVGFDVHLADAIVWVKKFEHLVYCKCAIQDIERFNLFENMTNSFVFSSGTLMYLTETEQLKLYEYLVAKGCRNMAFHEYSDYSGGNFMMPRNMFNKTECGCGSKPELFLWELL